MDTFEPRFMRAIPALERLFWSGILGYTVTIPKPERPMPDRASVPYRYEEEEPLDVDASMDCFMQDVVARAAHSALCTSRKKDKYYNTNYEGRQRDAQRATRDHIAGCPTVLPGYGLYLCFARGMTETLSQIKQTRQELRKHRKEFQERLRKAEQKEDEAWLQKYGNRRRRPDWWANAKSEYWRMRRWWFSERLQSMVYIYENTITGKVKLEVSRCQQESNTSMKTELIMNTMKASEAWTIEAEQKALELLKRFVTEKQFASYFLVGAFPEISRKSGRLYVFRRCRPLLRFKRTYPDQEHYKFETALCAHPMGYYSMSWAGAMCPTDEVIAQLLWMRSDELALWKAANHHSSRSACADI